MKKYLTVKEFAEAAGITQQAVYKQIDNGRLKNYTEVIEDQKMIRTTAFKRFYPKRVEQVEQLNSTAQNLEKSDLNPDLVQPIQPAREIQLLEDQISDLREQLEENKEEILFLRGQVAAKDSQIFNLTDNLKIAQQLAAADKKKILEIEEKQREQEENKQEIVVPEEEKKEKSWFRRFLGI